MFFRFRCSRRVFPPVVPGLRFRPDFRPAFPSGGAWFAERFRAPSAFGGLSVFAGVSALRPFSAFPSGISARRLGLCYRLLFPVCVSARHFPPAVLVRFCLPVFCMRLLPHTAKNAPAGTRTLACSAAPPAAGTVLSNRRRLRQRRNPRRTGCKVTYNSLIIAAFTIYSQFLQQRLRSP